MVRILTASSTLALLLSSTALGACSAPTDGDADVAGAGSRLTNTTKTFALKCAGRVTEVDAIRLAGTKLTYRVAATKEEVLLPDASECVVDQSATSELRLSCRGSTKFSESDSLIAGGQRRERPDAPSMLLLPKDEMAAKSRIEIRSGQEYAFTLQSSHNTQFKRTASIYVAKDDAEATCDLLPFVWDGSSDDC